MKAQVETAKETAERIGEMALDAIRAKHPDEAALFTSAACHHANRALRRDK